MATKFKNPTTVGELKAILATMPDDDRLTVVLSNRRTLQHEIVARGADTDNDIYYLPIRNHSGGCKNGKRLRWACDEELAPYGETSGIARNDLVR